MSSYIQYYRTTGRHPRSIELERILLLSRYDDICIRLPSIPASTSRVTQLFTQKIRGTAAAVYEKGAFDDPFVDAYSFPDWDPKTPTTAFGCAVALCYSGRRLTRGVNYQLNGQP